MNRLTSTTTAYSFLTARNFTVQYGYDAASNRHTMTDAESGQYVYTYDALNRLQNIQDFQQLNYGFTYDALSRRKTLTRPNSITTSYSYDSMSHLLSILHKNSGGTTLDGAAYTYDPAGNRLTRTPKPSGTALTFTFDNIYQLLTAKQGTTTKESYTYDLVGNRLSSLGVSPYQYNASNELTSIPGTTYSYDLNGSLTGKSDGTQYQWDYENRLTQAVVPGVGTTTFKYDPFGRRIQKSGPSGTINYLYDGYNLVEEVDNTGTPLARYTQGQTIDEPLAELRGSATDYFQADGLGSITSLSDPTPSLANTYTYDSFGKLTASSGTVVNPFRYTGRESDAETAIYEYRARYYDQSIGRFIAEDPLRFTAGTNFYAYVKNQAVLKVDPLGLSGGMWDWAWNVYSRGRDAWDTAKARAHQIECTLEYEYCIHGAFGTLYSTSQASQGAPVYTPDELENPTRNNEFSHGAHQVLVCVRGENCQKLLDDCLLGWISGGMFPH